MPTYGQRPGDVVTDSFGNALSGVTLTFYLTQADANASENAVGQVETDTSGRWRFDWTDGELWISIGVGLNQKVYRVDSTLEGSTALGRALLAALTRDSARRLVGITVGPTPPSDPQVGDLYIPTS